MELLGLLIAGFILLVGVFHLIDESKREGLVMCALGGWVAYELGNGLFW